MWRKKKGKSTVALDTIVKDEDSKFDVLDVAKISNVIYSFSNLHDLTADDLHAIQDQLTLLLTAEKH